jgi:DDE superfamily endonuclease
MMPDGKISFVIPEVDFIQTIDKKRKAEEASLKILPKEKEEMLTLPTRMIHVLRHFETVLSERVWDWATVLIIGAILAPGERTVAAILRVMGCAHDKHCQNYHRVLNRAKWSSRELSRVLLVVLVKLFVPADAPMVIGCDETIERRRGRQIAARGVYRDPVRSSKEFFVRNPWLALDFHDALDAHSLGAAGVGFAFFDRVGSI